MKVSKHGISLVSSRLDCFQVLYFSDLVLFKLFKYKIAIYRMPIDLVNSNDEKVNANNY